MRVIESITGESLSVAVKRMVDLTPNEGTVELYFNEVRLIAGQNDDGLRIIRYFKNECSRQEEAYRKSPEGKLAADEDIKDRKSAQNLMNESMRVLLEIDFVNFGVVVDWLEKVQSPSDHIGVVVPSAKIIKIFRSHGYEPGENCGKEFDGGNEENYARRLIGQALSNLKRRGSVRQLFHKFSRDFRSKFHNN